MSTTQNPSVMLDNYLTWLIIFYLKKEKKKEKAQYTLHLAKNIIYLAGHSTVYILYKFVLLHFSNLAFANDISCPVFASD